MALLRSAASPRLWAQSSAHWAGPAVAGRDVFGREPAAAAARAPAAACQPEQASRWFTRAVDAATPWFAGRGRPPRSSQCGGPRGFAASAAGGGPSATERVAVGPWDDWSPWTSREMPPDDGLPRTLREMLGAAPAPAPAGDSELDDLLSDFDPGAFPSLADVSAPAADAAAESRRLAERLKQARDAATDRRKIDGRGRSYGLGKRKTATAHAWLSLGTGVFRVNGLPLDARFASPHARATALAALERVGLCGLVDLTVNVSGGGLSAQATAVQQATAKAIQAYEPATRPYLRDMLKRDPRMVERKHTGKHKARKAFQWVKR